MYVLVSWEKLELLVRCNACNSWLMNRDDLKRHYWLSHRTELSNDVMNSLVRCEYCNVWFMDETGLRVHCKKTHSEEQT